MPLPRGVRCVLLDIEGTTTPISFVYETLFPYAEERLPQFFAEAEPGTPEGDAVGRLRDEYDAEPARDELPPFGDGTDYARFLMKQDRKATALKAIQGLIWRKGYEMGELRGELFPDVAPALRAWRSAGIRLCVFSSGSVLAQRLLFGTTIDGDLTPLFDGFYDTRTGPKKSPTSYAEIAASAEVEPAAVLFLSDVPAELDAAAAAGMLTGLFVRPGNADAEPGRHPTYHSFEELL